MQFDLKKPAHQRLLLIVLAAVGVMAVFFATRLLPFTFLNQRERIQAMRATYDQKATELARARATAADLPRFEAEYNRLHNQWTHASELLPMERQLPVIMRRVTLSARENGITLQSFRPGAARADQHYTETPISVQVAGDYHQLGSFLAELANVRRIVTVSDLRLKTNMRDEETPGSTAAEMKVSVYHLNTGSAPAVGTPSAQPPAANAKKEDDHDKKS